MKKWIFCLLVIMTSAVFAQALITKVIPLHYVDAKVVMPALNSLLQPGESISTANNQLVVNVSPDTLTRLRVVLHQLDAAPVSFQVSVHQGTPNWLSSQEGDIVYNSSTQSDEMRNQSITVINGSSAFISTGNNVPVLSSVSGGAFSGVSYQRQQVGKGIYIQPVLEGQKVKLKIHRINSQSNLVNNQVIDNQSVDTTVLIPLNKWVKLGSAAESQLTDTSSAQTYQAGASFNDTATLFIKVNLVK